MYFLGIGLQQDPQIYFFLGSQKFAGKIRWSVGGKEGRKDARARNIFAQGKRRKESCLKVLYSFNVEKLDDDDAMMVVYRQCHDFP